MKTNRLEAFFDAVCAIIITVMVIELKIPQASNIESLYEILLQVSIYLVSFIFIAVVWINHHHMYSMCNKLTSRLIWTHILLLFFISLVPFLTKYVTESHFNNIAVMLYGINLFFIVFLLGKILKQIEITIFGKNHSVLLFKEVSKLTFTNILIVLAIILCYFNETAYISYAIYLLIVIIWILPSEVYIKYHELLDQGIDINKNKEQFKIAFKSHQTENAKRKYYIYLFSKRNK